MVTERRGQALVELAVGMFTLALLVSALCTFAVYIAKSLRAENELRADGSFSKTVNERVAVGTFAAENYTGAETLTIHERLKMPSRVILR